MTRFVFKLPDLGEGTVEAEIVAWRVKPGDEVAEDDIVAEVMTEKAVVEVPAPVSGRVVSITGGPGDRLPVGSDLIVFETSDGARTPEQAAPAAAGQAAAPPSAAAGTAAAQPSTTQARVPAPDSKALQQNAPSATIAEADRRPRDGNGNGAGHDARAGASMASTSSAQGTAPAQNGAHHRNGRVVTSPAIRRRAREAGVDLTSIPGSGPNGRIMRRDFEDFVSSRRGAAGLLARPKAPAAGEGVEEIKVIGLRRVIAQRMSESKRNIPHFAYVEEVDVTELESLRRHLNSKAGKGSPPLTYLPFLVAALTRVLRDFPQCNALYDAERGVLLRHDAAHVGIATQTPDGLKVPVVRDARNKSLWQLAAEIRRVSEAARTNKASREELSGSTITVTSLGKLGGIVSTPIINAPEMAIIGVNRAVERPVVRAGAITVRLMMNLSSSFDHRFVDGHDAAAMIQALKERLEHPATIFIDPPA